MTSLATNAHTHFSNWRDAELAELFSTLPAGEAPSGYLHGRLFAIRGLGALPRPLAQAIYRLLSTPINPWRGKSFRGGEGCNHLLWRPGAGPLPDQQAERHG